MNNDNKMNECPNTLKYTRTHEWIAEDADGIITVGITDYAQKQLGDIVFVNLPEEGAQVEIDQAFADVESVKAVVDINSPVTGTVVSVNEELLDAPESLNEVPYDAWIIKAGYIVDKEELLEAEEYIEFCESEEGTANV